MTPMKSLPTNEKFQNAEQLWFWFIYSKQINTNFVRRNTSTRPRVCELLDVEIMVTRLYLSGRLTDEQLSVMKEFGDKRRAPHQYKWSENNKAAMWRTAMRTLETAAKQKDWID